MSLSSYLCLYWSTNLFVGLVPIVYLLLFVPWLIVEAALPLTGDLTQYHDVAVGDPLIAQLIT
jgi:hypothetical protein